MSRNFSGGIQLYYNIVPLILQIYNRQKNSFYYNPVQLILIKVPKQQQLGVKFVNYDYMYCISSFHIRNGDRYVLITN